MWKASHLIAFLHSCFTISGWGGEGFIKFTRYERHVFHFQKTSLGILKYRIFWQKSFMSFIITTTYCQMLSGIDDTEGLESWLINDGIPFDRIRMGGDWRWHIFGVKVLDHVSFTGHFIIGRKITLLNNRFDCTLVHTESIWAAKS